MSTIVSTSKRVAAGVAWLDERAPDWWRPLIPSTVPFTHNLYGRDHLWNYVYRELKVPYLRPTQRIDLGFDPGAVWSVADYDDLSDEWARVVRERHATGLTFTRRDDESLGPVWTLRGPDGAVTFGPMGIDYHSPTPLYNDDEPTSENCPAIGGNRCWSDGSSLLGQQLRERWERAGNDDAVIRTELESWYAEFPARQS